MCKKKEKILTKGLSKFTVKWAHNEAIINVHVAILKDKKVVKLLRW